MTVGGPHFASVIPPSLWGPSPLSFLGSSTTRSPMSSFHWCSPSSQSLFPSLVIALHLMFNFGPQSQYQYRDEALLRDPLPLSFPSYLAPFILRTPVRAPVCSSSLGARMSDIRAPSLTQLCRTNFILVINVALFSSLKRRKSRLPAPNGPIKFTNLHLG